MSGTGIRQRITASSLLERRLEVSRALIPCGGRGVRMRSITGRAPKELLEVAGVSALEHVLRECASSLITHALVLVAPGKETIAFKVARLAGMQGFPKEITLLEQPDALGLADAIGRGRDVAPAEPLAVVLPSVLYKGDRPAIAQLISAYRTSLTTVVGLVEARAGIAATRVAVPVVEGTLDGDDVQITRLPDPDAVGAPVPAGGVTFTFGGRYVLAPDAYIALDATLRSAVPGTETDVLPVLHRLLLRGQLAGKLIRGRYCDLSVPVGLDDAKIAFAMP